MNYLVVKLSSLGDIIMATPCLRALRRHDPQAHIAVAVGRQFLPLIEHNPHINEILIRETQLKQRRLRTIGQAVATFAKRRGPRFDFAFDLQGNFHSAAWTYCSGAKIKAGIGHRRFGWSVTLPIDHNRHAADLCAAILRDCGIPVNDLTPELHLCPEANRLVAKRLQSVLLPGHGFVLISPFSMWRSKDWPLERYAVLIRHLATEFDLPIVITGAEADSARANRLMASVHSTGAISLVGTVPLDQALCLYQRARVVISGDSGPMHAAAALGTPVVALFGPTWPGTTGPLGQAHRVIQSLRPPTHTTYREQDAERYMLAIEEADVFHHVRQCLTSQRCRLPSNNPEFNSDGGYSDQRAIKRADMTNAQIKQRSDSNSTNSNGLEVTVY